MFMGATINVVVEDVGGECDDGCTKAWEEVPEHCAIREYGVLAPDLAFSPRITVERRRGHRL